MQVKSEFYSHARFRWKLLWIDTIYWFVYFRTSSIASLENINKIIYIVFTLLKGPLSPVRSITTLAFLLNLEDGGCFFLFVLYFPLKYTLSDLEWLCEAWHIFWRGTSSSLNHCSFLLCSESLLRSVIITLCSSSPAEVLSIDSSISFSSSFAISWSLSPGGIMNLT